MRLFEIFESEAKIYLVMKELTNPNPKPNPNPNPNPTPNPNQVMEELTGGELFDRLVTLGKYTEDDARYFSFKLLNAVLRLHDH